MKKNQKYYTISELAKMLGISRVAIFNKIKSGKIKAERIGHIYAIPAEEFNSVLGTVLTKEQKRVIDEGISKTFKDYKKVLIMLGKA